MVTAAKGPMEIPAPAKQDAPPGLIADVLDDSGASRKQRWIGWACGIATAVAAVLLWELF